MFTPLGFTEQDAPENEKDPWGHGGGFEWQRHRSGWTPEDFPAEQGWTVFVCKDFIKKMGTVASWRETQMGPSWGHLDRESRDFMI